MINQVTIIVPEAADNSNELVQLTKFLTKSVFKGKWQGGGLLGGEFGYGVNYENDTFMMHSFCWCDNDDCKWCGEENAPNFLYKPTGAKIWWYKWIGRDQIIEGKLPRDWLKSCKKSVKIDKDTK